MKKYLILTAVIALFSCRREIIKQRTVELGYDQWVVSTYAWYKMGIVWVHYSWEDHAEGNGTIPADSVRIVKTRDSLIAAGKLQTLKRLENAHH